VLRGSERPVRGERTRCIGILKCSRVAEVWTFQAMLSGLVVSAEIGQQAFGPLRPGGLVWSLIVEESKRLLFVNGLEDCRHTSAMPCTIQ